MNVEPAQTVLLQNPAERSGRYETLCTVVSALRKNAHGGLNHVKCEYDEGMVILRGKVSSFYLKQLAQEIVMREEGVKRVDNRVEVAWPLTGMHDEHLRLE